ncbi:hypothetical protein GE21DRAFT_1291583 [Neurospora crassa]|nr:hypothetical protein GE21DRAFT_1291583 [Neurospora crassa]
MRFSKMHLTHNSLRCLNSQLTGFFRSHDLNLIHTAPAYHDQRRYSIALQQEEGRTKHEALDASKHPLAVDRNSHISSHESPVRPERSDGLVQRSGPGHSRHTYHLGVIAVRMTHRLPASVRLSQAFVLIIVPAYRSWFVASHLNRLVEQQKWKLSINRATSKPRGIIGGF